MKIKKAKSGLSAGDVSADGAPVGKINESDVKAWLAYGYGNGWPAQDEVCVVELNDGRFVAWASWSDVTGSGFHADAYGGDAQLIFGHDLWEVVKRIPEQDRESLKWDPEMEVHP